MVGQKYAEPVVATIVMSLESVFAALSGWLILSEHLKGRELAGCILVFTAVILAQLPERQTDNHGQTGN
ncbi:MAG: DMT family transporter, partial [Lachnospiraceae bacterium]|nr:DMT family transporter [Lachnospiraceae bacterium]